MRSRLILFGAVTLGLSLTGAGLRPIAARLSGAVRAKSGAGRMESAVAAAGRGLTLGVLGGFRAIAADFAWVRLYMIWERRDLPAVETLTQLVTTLDPRPVYFWVNGARIIAYDMPSWRIGAAGGYDRVAEIEQQRIQAEQARLALRKLDEAAVFHGDSPDLWIERANIELTRLHDVAAAAVSYRRAWERKNGPYYAARLHAEMLRRLGRKADALAWLVQLHPQLPPDEEPAGAGLVLARIRELERELGVEGARAYRPQVWQGRGGRR